MKDVERKKRVQSIIFLPPPALPIPTSPKIANVNSVRFVVHFVVRFVVFIADPARGHIRRLQDSFTALEQCRKPVICAIQGACYGGGVDMAVACDIRYCSSDARFCVKAWGLSYNTSQSPLSQLDLSRHCVLCHPWG